MGFDNLQKLAEILDVPVAYLLAETPAMADTILALSRMSEDERADVAKIFPNTKSAKTR